MHLRKQDGGWKERLAGMDSCDFSRKWKTAFAADVSAEVMQGRVDAAGCHMWHVFTWGKARCFEQAAADAAFDAADKKGAFVAEESAFNGGGKKIAYRFRACPPDARSLDFADGADVFVVGKNFAWTYVVTHEAGLGPYFAAHGRAGGSRDRFS